jgi:hypothetical protein
MMYGIVYVMYVARNILLPFISKYDDLLTDPSDLSDQLIGQLRSSDQALPVTARRAKRENGGLWEDPPGNTIAL